jgi:hypothetical protein
MKVWPLRSLPPKGIQWEPTGGRVAGGRSLGGVVQEGRFDGGPFWTLSLTGMAIQTVAKIRLAKALRGLLDSGLPIEVDTREAAFTGLAAGATRDSVPFSDGSAFDDGSEFDASPVTATVVADTPLRATSLTFDQVGLSALQGGEEFTVVTASGPRMHRIIEVGGTIAQPTVSFIPPLREAVIEGQALDFNRPRCAMKMVQMSVPREGRFATVDASFIEYFD